MKYNFETFQDRTKTGSFKYHLMAQIKPDVSEGIVPLSTADMEFNVAPEIIEGLKAYIDGAILGYQMVTEEYRDIVVDWFKRRYKTEIQASWISPSAGVVDGFYGGVLAFTEPGDGIIVMPPVYGPFYGATEGTGRKLIECDLIEENESHLIDFERFEDLAKDPNAKALLFSNPHNPGGRVWTREELERLGNICLENDIIIISDEIHADFIFYGNVFTSFLNISPEISQNVLVCHAPNKSFNIAGLQAGNNIIPNPDLKKKYDEMMARYRLAGTNSIALKATELAYSQGEAWLDELLQVLEGNITYFIDRVSGELPKIRLFKPEGSYLVWMDMGGLGYTEEELDDIIVNKAELFLNPGSFFREKRPCYKRINLAAPRYVIEGAVDRLVEAFKE